MTGIGDFRSLEEYRQWLRMFRLFRDYPMDEIRRKGLEHLPRIRAKVGGSYYQDLVDDWASALRAEDPSELRSVALDATRYGVDMRQINPLQGIMSQRDVMQVVKDSRDEQRRILSSAQGVVAHH